MKRKTFEVKARADEAGSFTALAAVFGNVDSVGDRILPGAFAKTLLKWQEAGDPIPVILSHQWDDPNAIVGKADPTSVKETPDGLLVEGTLDIRNNAVAKQVHHLMSERLLKGWSFGYTVPSGGEKQAEDGANDISEIELIEVGPTLKGANPEAQLQSVKSAVHAKGVAERLVKLARDIQADPDDPALPERVREAADSLTPPEAVEDERGEAHKASPEASDGDQFHRARINAH